MKDPHPLKKDDDKVTTKAPVADKPDGPKERYAAIHFLIDQIRREPKQSGSTIEALDKIVHHLDLLEGKPEAVEAEKRRLAEIDAANAEQAKAEAEQAKADAAKAKEDAKA
jgi:hypothetical protein